MVNFGTKAETLALLEGKLEHGKVLPQLRISVAQWKAAGCNFDRLDENTSDWIDGTLIVRSSGKAEDSFKESLAGHFLSVAGVVGQSELNAAIETVIASFCDDNPDDQVFIQPMLEGVRVSGVAFTRDANSASHYYIVNYDDKSGATDSVTDGRSNDLHTFYCAKAAKCRPEGWLGDLLDLLDELERSFSHDALDVEFAVDHAGELVLLQVRQLILKEELEVSAPALESVLSQLEQRVKSLSAPHPYLRGKRSVFGVMPDWNPAEIIGIRPRPLALSLYKELVTDNIWAYQRGNYGYRNLRSFPLLISFAGQPFIDVRVSFNSFIPADIDEELAERLVNYYVDRLVAHPNYHDKVEFEIIYSCYTPDLPERLEILKEYGFSSADRERFADSLRTLTNRIIGDKEGIWHQDIIKLEELERRQRTMLESELPLVEKIYWLLEDCKRYGTLPFAGLARAAFIAVQLLHSFVAVGVFSEDEREKFMSSLQTVSSGLAQDLSVMGRETFLDKYGHLRPGTYNVLSPRYDEKPDIYFDWSNRPLGGDPPNGFMVSIETLNRIEALLIEHRLEHDVLSLFNFIKGAIEGREYAKFMFSRSLSDAIRLITDLGETHGFDKQAVSFVDIDVIKKLYTYGDDTVEMLRRSIDQGHDSYRITEIVNLPPLIVEGGDVWSFSLPKCTPNFVTLRSVCARVVDENAPHDQLVGKILMIPSADPGYDWVFSHGIGGLVTMFGGANSHMAIRAAELEVPAVIGAGETLYAQWRNAGSLSIDCAARQVKILR